MTPRSLAGVESKSHMASNGLHIQAEAPPALIYGDLNSRQKMDAHWLFSSQVDSSAPRGIVQPFAPK